MTVQQLIDELSKYGLDRNVEFDTKESMVIPERLDWDPERRCVVVFTEEAPTLHMPYIYEDEEECPDCGNIVERGEACFCGE
jgi:hypothetical protein